MQPYPQPVFLTESTHPEVRKQSQATKMTIGYEVNHICEISNVLNILAILDIDNSCMLFTFARFKFFARFNGMPYSTNGTFFFTITIFTFLNNFLIGYDSGSSSSTCCTADRGLDFLPFTVDDFYRKRFK